MAPYAHPEVTSLAPTLAPASLIRAHMHVLSISFRRHFPVEIQERIIDQLRLRDDVRSLRACSLTCHAWHVRSRFHLFRDIRIRGPEQFNDICSYFRIHESLGSLVQSVCIDTKHLSSLPDDTYPRTIGRGIPASNFVCAQLFAQLPNLHRVQLIDTFTDSKACAHHVTFHPSILTYLTTRSSIHTLYLRSLRFPSPKALGVLLTSLPRLTHLECDWVDIGGTMDSVQVVELGPAYYRKATKLRCLAIHRTTANSPIESILSVAGGTVEHLKLDIQQTTMKILSGHNLESVRAAVAGVKLLELHVRPQSRALFHGDEVHSPETLRNISSILRAFDTGVLRDLLVVFHGHSYHLQHLLQNAADPILLRDFQHSIIGLSLDFVTFTIATPTSQGSQSSMLADRTLKQCFPVLYEGALAKTVVPGGTAYVGHESSIHTLQVSLDGLWTASADDSSVILWSTEHGSIVKEWTVSHGVYGLIFTPDRHLAICSGDRLVVRDMTHSFNIVAETRLPRGSPNTRCLWSPNRALCALARWRDGRHGSKGYVFHISIHRTETTEVLFDHKLTSRSPGVWLDKGFAFSQDSHRLLFFCAGTIDDDTEEDTESICWIWDMYSTAPPRKLTNYGPPVHHSAFHPTNSSQVFIALTSGIIQIRDVASGVVLTNLAVGHKLSHAPRPLYSPNGIYIATTTDPWRHTEVRLCNTKTAAVLEPIACAQANSFFWISFSPDGTRVLSSSSNTPAQLWDPHTARPILSLEAHINPIEIASFSPDSRLLALGYENGTVRLWDVSDGNCLAMFTEHTARVTHLVFSAGGDTLCSAGDDDRVYIRRLREILPHLGRSQGVQPLPMTDT